MDCSMPGFLVHHQLLEFTQIHVHWVGDAIQPIFPSMRVFSNGSALCIRWPKYWSFSFSITPSNEYSGLISFRMDWLDLLAVQGTLKSLQHHSSKASIICAQLSLYSNSAILWNSALKWVYISFSILLFTSLLFTAICKASSGSHFAFFFSFLFLGDSLDPCHLCNVTNLCP